MINLEYNKIRPALILSLGLAPLSMLPQGTQLTIYDQTGSKIRQYVLEITSNQEGEKEWIWHIK